MRLQLTKCPLKGRIIAVAGTDGSGKSTIMSVIRQYIENVHGQECVVSNLLSDGCRQLTHFRSYAQDPASAVLGLVDLPSLCFICLGDRLMTLRSQVVPLLERGTWLICDRYVYTSMAELMALDYSTNDIDAVASTISLFPEPSLCILADVHWEVAIRRIRLRKSEYYKVLHPWFYQRLTQTFRHLALSNDFVLVPTNGDGRDILPRLKTKIDELVDGLTARHI
jgi:dTMP kinase